MANHLSGEASPYLQQHVNNPVDWYPWGEEALHKARQEAKPILLSIGYSTCHWCHVMAHESFADEQIAQVMNSHFVNIKVDREERPDLDKVYQTALQLINPQGGGWPLTMFLDPQTLLPFFGGTYFPPEPRYQLPGFSDLLLRLSEVFNAQYAEISEQGDKLKATLEQMTPPLLEPELADVALLKTAREQLGQQYDQAEGGFGQAPKFPMPNALMRLLRHWAHARRSGDRDSEALDMVMISLTQMARGGIYDHLGGGFCRYATDRKWMIPHFEKMLYDNAQLLTLYSQALTLGPDALFEGAVTETIAWLEREMRSQEGAFYAAIDADSEGEEGKFYVWRREQVKKALNEDEYLLVETLYGLDKPANFENKWNLHRYDSWRSVVERLSLAPDAALELLATARTKLLALRGERIPPATDEKILTAWNGLLIRGLADAAVQFDRPEWLAMAQQATDFLRSHCWQDGQLYATYQAGQPLHHGYLDDYANLLHGVLGLLEVEWRESDIKFATQLADALLEQFLDPDKGGFYFTAKSQEQLIYRPKPTMDDALPPGNGVAAQALLRLGELLGEVKYSDAAHHTLAWARAVMEKVPAAHCSLLHALEEVTYAPQLVIMRGPIDELRHWRASIRKGFTPWRSVYLIPYDAGPTLPAYLPKLVSSEKQAAVTAYVCSGTQCSLPITELEALQAALD
ncbi:MAG: thioredoxin domain-containing protein [Pseudomonadales bacterium]